MRKQKKHWKEAMNERNQDWIDSREKPKEIVNKPATDIYRANWERIFGGKRGTSDTEKPTE